MKRIFGFLLLASGIMLYSCHDENIDIPTDGTLSEKAAQITLNEVALESATTELEYEMNFYTNAEFALSQRFMVGKMWRWNEKLRYKMNQCPGLSIESEDGGYPKTITLDYGDSTVLHNGTVLSGVIVIEISGPRSSVDYTRLVTYIDFGVDTLTINGTCLVTFDKENSVFRTMTSDVIVEMDNGLTIERTSERTWEWIEGMDTELDQTDDVIQITGFSNAETSEGDIYRKDITEPLIRPRDCKYIVKGIVEITLNSELISTLNYGDGECDDVATLTKDGESYEVDLAGCKMKYDNGQGKAHNNGSSNGNGNGKGH